MDKKELLLEQLDTFISIYKNGTEDSNIENDIVISALNMIYGQFAQTLEIIKEGVEELSE